jgi:hypothetical protein
VNAIEEAADRRYESHASHVEILDAMTEKLHLSPKRNMHVIIAQLREYVNLRHTSGLAVT